MRLFRSALKTLIVAGAVSAAITSAGAETAKQHQEWARKFGPVDPVATGAVNGLQSDIAVQTEPSGCGPGSWRFDNLPFDLWRIDRCDAPPEASQAQL